MEYVIACAAVECIVARFAIKKVVCAVAEQLVITLATSQDIVDAVIASQSVSPGCTVHRLLLQQFLPAQYRTVGKGKTIHAPTLTARIKPIRQGYLIAIRADLDCEIIVAGFLQTKISQCNTRAKRKCIGTFNIIGSYRILAIAQVEYEHVIAGTAGKRVIACATN